MPSFAPRIRVEVYVPVRYETAYQDAVASLIRESTELRGVASCLRIREATASLKQIRSLMTGQHNVLWLSDELGQTIRSHESQGGSIDDNVD